MQASLIEQMSNAPASKVCYRCHVVKPLQEFHRDSSSKDGYTHKCKPCQLAYKAQWQKRNRDKANTYRRRHDEKNIERLRQTRIDRAQRLRQQQITRSFERAVTRYLHRREAELIRSETPRMAKWRDKRRRKAKARAYARRRVALGLGYVRYHTDVMYNTHGKVTVAIRHHLKCAGIQKKRQRTFGEILPYTKEQLIERLKQTIPAGYTWQDYLDGKLQIDHIIPKRMFAFESVNDPQFQSCWALRNLQLLPRKENASKNGRITAKHHPELALWHNSMGPTA